MKYSEAFQALGYQLIVPISDWTAAGDHGVCISLWQREIGWENGQPFHDSRECGGPLETWRRKPGNAKRIEHLRLAIDRFDGLVDDVVVRGNPKMNKCDDAYPWRPEERMGFRWRVTYLDPLTGHFGLELKAAD